MWLDFITLCQFQARPWKAWQLSLLVSWSTKPPYKFSHPTSQDYVEREILCQSQRVASIPAEASAVNEVTSHIPAPGELLVMVVAQESQCEMNRWELQSIPGKKAFVIVQFLSHVWLFLTPWTAASQASLSFTTSCSLLKLTSIESVIPSNHLILCCPLLLLPSIFPSIRVFSNESACRIRWPKYWNFSFSIRPSNESVQFSSVIQLCLYTPHGPKRARLPCPSPTPGVYSNSCPLSWWCHPTISSSVVPFSSCLQSFPASGYFQMSQFFTSSGQSVGVSALASVLPMNMQDWFPLGLTGWISLQSTGLSRVFSNTTV